MNRKITQDDYEELLRLRNKKMKFVAQQAFTGFRYAFKRIPQKGCGCVWERGGKGVPVTAGRLLFVQNSDTHPLDIDYTIKEYERTHTTDEFIERDKPEHDTK